MKRPDSPMAAPSWYMSVDFCRKLGALTGVSEEQQPYVDPKALIASGLTEDGRERGYPENWLVRLDHPGLRLPTEAEWGVACRGGMLSRYSFGTDSALLSRYGWYVDSSGKKGHAVRTLRPNARGLFDMHGNLFEWCHDWHGAFGEQSVDPVGASQPSDRVLRSGSWDSPARACRSSYRNWMVPSGRRNNLGFRLAATIPSSNQSGNGAESEDR